MFAIYFVKKDMICFSLIVPGKIEIKRSSERDISAEQPEAEGIVRMHLCGSFSCGCFQGADRKDACQQKTARHVKKKNFWIANICFVPNNCHGGTLK